MILHLHENLRTLRLQRNLTQEQLAEILDLSPQAVSRWETGSTCPDITLLPVLARFYGVTLDQLVGMEQTHERRDLNEIFTEAHDLVRQGKTGRAAALLREGIRDWPDTWSLYGELALVLTRTGETESLREALRLSELVLEHAQGEKLRHTVKANLCRIHMGLGETEKARVLARTLPHIWESREMMLPETDPEETGKCLRILMAALADRRSGKGPDLMLGYDGTEDVPELSWKEKNNG